MHTQLQDGCILDACAVQVQNCSPPCTHGDAARVRDLLDAPASCAATRPPCIFWARVSFRVACAAARPGSAEEQFITGARRALERAR